ncbi:MAG: chemotaxis protein CheW [Chloroflexota bacterium]
MASKEEQVVVFTLAGESYGVDIATVHEIIRMQHVTRVPRAPEFVEGVTNLRGRVIPVVDLRRRFGLAIAENTASTRIVVVEIGDHTIGAVVDSVSEVLRIPADSIELPSPVITTVDSDYLRGIAKLDGRLIILLSLDKVLSADNLESLSHLRLTAETAISAA